MDSDRVIRLLEDAWGEPVGSLSSESEVAGEWESVALLVFMATVDQEFGVVLSPERLLQCRTVADVVGLVREAA